MILLMYIHIPLFNKAALVKIVKFQQKLYCVDNDIVLNISYKF